MKKIEINSRQFQKALKKAIKSKPLVRVGATPDLYLVRSSSGDFYPVRFQRAAGGQMLGSCLCAGAMRGFNCYHLAAALLTHSAFVRAGLRSPAPRRAMAGEPPPAENDAAEIRAEIEKIKNKPVYAMGLRFACHPRIPSL